MAVFDLFSRRQKKQRGEVPDVYTYDSIPQELRIQIIHLWLDMLGRSGRYGGPSNDAYSRIHSTLCREYGRFTLGEGDTHQASLTTFFLVCPTNEALDTIELSFKLIIQLCSDDYDRAGLGSTMTAGKAIEELNARFRQWGVGYQFESGEIVRVDSQIIHAQIVKPTLALLREAHYQGANAEFLKAFEHYRHGNLKECLNECLKAFESTMKAICSKRGWKYNGTDTAKALIEICYAHKLIPDSIQSHLGSVRASLESGVPTIRNKFSGHGQGATVVTLPPYYASYMLHLTATTILFLVEAERALP